MGAAKICVTTDKKFIERCTVSFDGKISLGDIFDFDILPFDSPTNHTLRDVMYQCTGLNEWILESRNDVEKEVYVTAAAVSIPNLPMRSNPILFSCFIPLRVKDESKLSIFNLENRKSNYFGRKRYENEEDEEKDMELKKDHYAGAEFFLAILISPKLGRPLRECYHEMPFHERILFVHDLFVSLHRMSLVDYPIIQCDVNMGNFLKCGDDFVIIDYGLASRVSNDTSRN